MSQDLPIKYLSYDDLRLEAESFLNRYYTERSIPIPIEEIIDLQFQLDIVPIPGIKASWEIDAFVTSDMDSIYVDEHVYQFVPNRFRFSLAHEIAHVVLHQKVFTTLSFNDIQSWKHSRESISTKDNAWLEWQAHAFAGLILVPEIELNNRFQKAVDEASNKGVSLEYATDVARRAISGYLAKQFKVSTAVVEKRIEKDDLWP